MTKRLDLEIPDELDHALNELVVSTRIAKASIVRKALAVYLAARGVLPKDAAAAIPFLPTTGLDPHKKKGQ